jgi:drug/metabolite transporter (DMT)-like permease
VIRALVLLLLTVVIWGLQPLAINLVLGVFSVGFTAFVRSVCAAVAFGVVHLITRKPTASEPPAAKRRARCWLVAGGLGLCLCNVLWNASLKRTTVGASSALTMSCTVVIALYGIFALRERVTTARAAGLALALGGMFLVSWNGQDLSALVSSRHFAGNLLALASGIGSALVVIAQKTVIRNRSSAATVAPIFASSALFCVVPLLWSPPLVARFSPGMFGLLVLTGLLGMGLGNALFTESVRTITASLAAAALAAAPLVSLTSATLLLGEPTSWYLLLGSPLTCAGVAAVVLTEPAAEAGRSQDEETGTGPEATDSGPPTTGELR